MVTLSHPGDYRADKRELLVNLFQYLRTETFTVASMAT